MTNPIYEALQNASKKELIDIIEERMYLDPVFRKTVENRLLHKNEPITELIASFKSQVEDEMSLRYPDTSVLRSACFNLKRKIDSLSLYDTLLADVAIIRSFDDALCNGAGMEDETDFELSMDVEEAQRNAIKKIEESQIDGEEKMKALLMMEDELKKPLDVFGEDIFLGIITALREAE